jgi:branched-chain amino acid transport system substrate-binding protein
MKRTLFWMMLPLCLLFSTLSSAQKAGYADFNIASKKNSLGKTDEIRIGSLIDLTGATADAGEDYAMGIAEAIHYANDKGGVNGTKIKLYYFDYGNRIPEAYAKYKLLKRLGCVAVLGWGADDTEALSPAVNMDKMPYLSATYPAHLTNPAKAPYNLSVSNDFSTSARAAITAWFDQKWPKHPDYKKRKPRLQCSYMFASPYAIAPIKAVKDQAKFLGFEIGPDQEVSKLAINTENQVLAMKNFRPDLVWHGNTSMSVAATVRDAFYFGLQSDHIVNNWGFDENLLRLAGKAAEGVMGATSCAFFGQNVPQMNRVVKYAKIYNPGVPLKNRLNRTVQAWANVLVLWEVLKRADKAGSLSGESILKNGFETMRGFDIGLGISPISFTSKDHRISGKIPIYEIRNGKFQILGVVDLKRRWPRRWGAQWHGW